MLVILKQQVFDFLDPNKKNYSRQLNCEINISVILSLCNSQFTSSVQVQLSSDEIKRELVRVIFHGKRGAGCGAGGEYIGAWNRSGRASFDFRGDHAVDRAYLRACPQIISR